MRNVLGTCAVCALAIVTNTSATSGQIAVTEFLNNATSEDDGREFIELYNFSENAIDLTGWTIADQDFDSLVLDGLSIEAGDFLILVGGSAALTGAAKKAMFEAEWLEAPDARVIGIDQAWALGNAEDEIVLTDDLGNTIWHLAYANDETNSYATFLTHDDYDENLYGNQLSPGIVREGDDNGQVGFLGYESQNSLLATDPNATVSSNGDTGSPLALSLDDGLLRVSLVGTCPGPVDLVVANASPGGTVAYIFAFNEGGVVIPGGNACAGTMLGVDATALLVGTRLTDANGAARLSGNVPALGCGGFVQVLNLNDCATSNVLQIP